MPRPSLPSRLFSGLGTRLVMLLSIALLPLGLIAVWQTREVTRSIREVAEVSVLALTEQAALGERRLLYTAIGAASALGSVLPEMSDDAERCESYLGNFVEQSQLYTYVGFLPLDGQVTCSSLGEARDVTESPLYIAQSEDPRLRIAPLRNAIISREDVVTVSVPVRRGDELIGFINVSIPDRALPESDDGTLTEVPLSMILFNQDGQVIAARGDVATAEQRLPANFALTDFVGLGPLVFSGEDGLGQQRSFAITPVVPDVAFAIGAWSPSQFQLERPALAFPPWLFPIMMWIASLVVAFFAVHRLVIRHVRSLGQQMRQFARNRRLVPGAGESEMALELSEMEDDFLQMADALIQDEAALENAVHEKNILLKEVHHRVKNNLQLISSIMNMQIRRARSRETKAILKRLQERILGLATIHRNLYETQDLGRTDAGRLVKSIVEQLTSSDEKRRPLELEVEHIEMFPDQAVPLSLLVAEATTNATKYMGTHGEGGTHPVFEVRLNRLEGNSARLVVRNSMAARTEADYGDEGVGLGSQLMQAFASQLGADIDIDISNGLYTVTAEFDVVHFKPDTQDY
ncbi:sensor histidine kinase [Tropicimonas sp. IMCC34011]|uniref:sensor histidine kinase n=1 Tax=Tropicimonas sp. IMCC34011 TaxID=2248759 RepID=UPI000E24E87B|nr:histidine kinase dimerization/phosphoacceptor domain -containing protein [Tropicimonas sp. IMCC34011]